MANNLWKSESLNFDIGLLAIITRLIKMVKKYILISCISLSCITAAQAGLFGGDDNNNTEQQQQQQQNNNYNGRGTVTGVMNRIPRRFDTQTLMNSGPGLLQETYYLFRRFGSGSSNQGKKIETPSSTNVETTTVLEPQEPQEPQAPIPIFQETNTERGTVLNPENESTQEQDLQLNKLPAPDEDELFIGNDPPPPLEKIKKPVLMLPAPQPGFVIRYNQERGVYEEVREIKIQNIETIE